MACTEVRIQLKIKATMEKTIQPIVTTLATGSNLITKQMQAKAGALLPKHLADKESMVFIHEGECILNIHDKAKVLKQGDAIVIPAAAIHQIKVVKDFKGVHIMPIDIKFEFFK